MIGNKQGYTFLNCVLKLLTNLDQLHLSSMQNIIVDSQQASLPGRSIHQAVMFMSEILHKAKKYKQAYMLKLDTMKTLNYLDRTFIKSCWNYV